MSCPGFTFDPLYQETMTYRQKKEQLVSRIIIDFTDPSREKGLVPAHHVPVPAVYFPFAGL
jgi:hypothetical protein